VLVYFRRKRPPCLLVLQHSIHVLTLMHTHQAWNNVDLPQDGWIDQCEAQLTEDHITRAKRKKKKKFLCTSKLRKSRFKTHIVFLPALAAVHRRYVRMRDVFFYYICDLAGQNRRLTCDFLHSCRFKTTKLQRHMPSWFTCDCMNIELSSYKIVWSSWANVELNSMYERSVLSEMLQRACPAY
jgi:hypothetical protein